MSQPSFLKKYITIRAVGISGVLLALLCMGLSCNSNRASEGKDSVQAKEEMTAADILGNYPAISFGGYRDTSRNIQPTVAQLKEDMRILAAMGVKILRTYNTKRKHASNVLAAIRQLKAEDPQFEMYVMLGAWIDCAEARTARPDHEKEDSIANAAEIRRAVDLANAYDDIVKIIAVGNEAMVKWAATYYVQAGVILKWVNHLQDLKASGKLPADLWITSSDNFASWGGGDEEYHTEDLEKLIGAVDYISLHTYPMHDTHYNPDFWGVTEDESDDSRHEKIDAAMLRARDYAIAQYRSVEDYVKSLGISKPIHIGETGWASASNGYYGPKGSMATDEYKEGIYYRLISEWTREAGVACFYFEAFDEPWKDAKNPGGSENHFGLFTVDGQAKYALWDLVDQGVFEGLTRDGNPITKTFDGNKAALMDSVRIPPVNKKLVVLQ